MNEFPNGHFFISTNPIPITAVLEKRAAARQEELCAAYERISRLEADLYEVREYLEKDIDVVDGSYGEPEPNRAMQLVIMIDQTLDGGCNA